MAAVFRLSLSQRHFTTELYSRPLKNSYFEVYTDTKHVWYKSFSFHAATKPFHAKQQIVHGTHKKSMKYTTTLWGVQTCLRKTRGIHHSTNVSTIGNLHLKSGPTLQKRPWRDVNNTPFWQQSHFMQTIRLHSSWYTHKRYETYQHCEVHRPFSAKQHTYINI